MSNELYPSNSSIIDLRSKISSIQTPSKTKQFINDLQRQSAMLMEQCDHNKTYENERWFTPKPFDDKNTSLPPRRSMFTPSRLQNLSAQKNREARKPYWRCPMPTTTSTTRKNSPTLLTDIDLERIMQSSSTTEIPSSTLQPTLKTIPMKSFVRRREPESGKKINVFNIDDEEITIDEADNLIESELANVQLPIQSGIPKAGFLTNDDNAHTQQISIDGLVFTFTDPIVREPKTPTPPPQSKIDYKEAGMQTEIEINLKESVEKNIQFDERSTKAIEGLAGKKESSTPYSNLPLFFPSAMESLINKIPTPVQMTAIADSSTPSTQKSLTIRGTEKRTQPMDWSFPMVENHDNEPIAPIHNGRTREFQPPIQNGIAAFQPANNGTVEAFQPTINGIASFQPTQIGTTGAFQFGGMASDVGDGGLSTRTGVSARKLLQARRMKKR